MSDAMILRDESRKVGRVVLAVFVLFFLTVATVNGVFIYMAERTLPGLVTENPYEKGLAYNKTLEEARAQKAEGVSGAAVYRDGRIEWRLTDEAGGAVSDAVVTARLVRAVRSGHDFDTVLTPDGNGGYAASLALPMEGAWTAKLEARRDDGRVYRDTLKFMAE